MTEDAASSTSVTARRWHASACGDVIRCLAMSPDDGTIAFGSWDKSASAYELNSLRQIAQVQHLAPVTAVALSADGAQMASASVDRVVNVTHLVTQKTVTVARHEAEVTALAFSDDGASLATGSADKSAAVHDLSSGLEMTRLMHDAPVTALAFSGGGFRLATGSADRTVRVFTIDTALMLREAASCSPRSRSSMGNVDRGPRGRASLDPHLVMAPSRPGADANGRSRAQDERPMLGGRGRRSAGARSGRARPAS